MRRLGRRLSRLLLVPTVLYFYVFNGDARRASRQYLRRVARARGASRAPGPIGTLRHLFAFADALLDRVSFWAGDYQDFEVIIHGREHLQPLLEARRAAILLGAHLGSFDVLRVLSRDVGVRVNVAGFLANARAINEMFNELDPASEVRLIEYDPASVRSAFEIKECIERGEFVAMSGERIPPGGRNRLAWASFLGDRAAFPKGPFLIPIIVGLPVVLCLALKTGSRRYEIFFEPLVDGERVRTRDREKLLQEHVEAYARRLECYCLRAPYQWFNFYDFWADSGPRHA